MRDRIIEQHIERDPEQPNRAHRTSTVTTGTYTDADINYVSAETQAGDVIVNSDNNPGMVAPHSGRIIVETRINNRNSIPSIDIRFDSGERDTEGPITVDLSELSVEYISPAELAVVEPVISDPVPPASMLARHNTYRYAVSGNNPVDRASTGTLTSPQTDADGNLVGARLAHPPSEDKTQLGLSDMEWALDNFRGNQDAVCMLEDTLRDLSRHSDLGFDELAEARTTLFVLGINPDAPEQEIDEGIIEAFAPCWSISSLTPASQRTEGRA